MIEEGDLIWTLMLSYFMQRELIDKRDKLILRAESNLTTIGLYIYQIKERLASFTVDSRDMVVREERCADYELETARMGGNIDALKVVVTKVEGQKDDLNGMVDIMTRGRTTLHGRRDDLSTEEEGNRADIAGLRFRLEKSVTR